MRDKIALIIIFIILILLTLSCDINDEIEVSYKGFGAQQTIGGSFHKLKVGDEGYIVDVGSFYGEEGENYPLPAELDVDNINAVFITHAHFDHMGRLPLLLYEGYDGPIFMTSVTRDILKVSLLSNIRYLDFGKEEFYYSKYNTSDMTPVYKERFSYGEFEVQEENREFIKSSREELNDKGFYLSSDTVKKLKEELEEKIKEQAVIVDYQEEINVNDDITAELLYTSHIPGSAMVKLRIDDKEVLFSGDIGGNNNPFLLNNASLPESLDYLFLEGTYGTDIREHEAAKNRQEFREYLGQAVDKNQRVIIPAFAVDRTQQVLYEINKGMEDNVIPEETKVNVFSPTSKKISKLYESYSNNPEEYYSYFSNNMFTEWFGFKNLVYNPRDENNLYDLEIDQGEIAIMTSGMMSHAFSVEIAENYVENEKTHFISVSYQDPEELGGKIFNGEESVVIKGEKYEVKAQIYSSKGFSSHAELEMIFNLTKGTTPEKIFLVHLNEHEGEPLKEAYKEKFSDSEILIPKIQQKYHLFSID